MAKVAIIGAGSLVFCKTLMNDFLATPALQAASILSWPSLTRVSIKSIRLSNA